MNLEIKLLNDKAKVPTLGTDKSAGYDLYSTESYTLRPMERRIFDTGIQIKLPDNTQGEIRPRSGNAIKKGITVLNSPGTVDCDYRNNIGVILINLSKENVHIEEGDRIAQMVIMPYLRPNILVVHELDATERTGGFGHTGD